jgi:hypothetical protein
MASERPKRPKTSGAASDHRLDALLDEALKDTFPASDPVAITVDADASSAPRAKTPARTRPARRRE